MVDALRHPNKEVKIALVGKYIALHDAYISVVEALKHGGIAERATIDLHWIDSETLMTTMPKSCLAIWQASLFQEDLVPAVLKV